MSDATNNNSFDYVNEIWNIADYVRDVIKRSEYNRVILPFTLLRRLECALEPTRDAVLDAFAQHEAEWGRESDNYCQSSRKAFYNITNFRLNNLGASNTLDALTEYINGFSPNAREILVKFKMEETCKTLQEHGMLYMVCQKFSAFDLSPETVSDRMMSDIYEHLIQRYGEEIAEDAEDFMTPKDIVRLAVGCVFANDDELMNSDKGIIRTLYDGCAGTGGFITDALEQLDEWHADKKMKAPALIVPYGQEIEAESWALCKASLLLRNIDNADSDIYDSIKDLSAHIAYGDTLSDDKYPSSTFNFQLTNPPYGKKFEKEKEDVEEESNRLGFNGRFGAGLPPISDGSMLFLQNVCSKFAPVSEGGGRAGIVLSASPLFTGDAGSGCSNIRRWLFEKDYIDCIIKLGTQEFFRTGINTYLWVLTNNKPENRKGYIQLIDASEMKVPMRKSLGNKRYEISEEQRDWIIDTYVNGKVNEHSVIVPYTDFMYRKVTTQQPLHMKIVLTSDKIDAFLKDLPKGLAKLSDDNKRVLESELTAAMFRHSENAYGWQDNFAKDARKAMASPNVGAGALSKAIVDAFGVRDPKFPAAKDKNGNYIPDPELKDTENIPFLQSFDNYMQTEVLPYAPEAWIDESVRDSGPLQDSKVGVVGTNISFNNYFYHYEEPRKPEEIAKEIIELEKGLGSFEEEFLK